MAGMLVLENAFDTISDAQIGTNRHKMTAYA